MQPRKEQLRSCVESAVASSECSALRLCKVEVVGSTSWGGEVPQSDLDLVLVASADDCDVALLSDLQKSLEARSDPPWRRLELLDSPRVPVLRLHDPQGLCCDVAVDRHLARDHRDFLRGVLAGRQPIRNLIQLVE